MRSFLKGLENQLEGYVESHTAKDRFYFGSVPLLMLYAVVGYYNQRRYEYKQIGDKHEE